MTGKKMAQIRQIAEVAKANTVTPQKTDYKQKLNIKKE